MNTILAGTGSPFKVSWPDACEWETFGLYEIWTHQTEAGSREVLSVSIDWSYDHTKRTMGSRTVLHDADSERAKFIFKMEVSCLVARDPGLGDGLIPCREPCRPLWDVHLPFGSTIAGQCGCIGGLDCRWHQSVSEAAPNTDVLSAPVGAMNKAVVDSTQPLLHFRDRSGALGQKVVAPA